MTEAHGSGTARVRHNHAFAHSTNTHVILYHRSIAHSLASIITLAARIECVINQVVGTSALYYIKLAKRFMSGGYVMADLLLGTRVNNITIIEGVLLVTALFGRIGLVCLTARTLAVAICERAGGISITSQLKVFVE